jgi:hypothetical protein
MIPAAIERTMTRPVVRVCCICVAMVLLCFLMFCRFAAALTTFLMGVVHHLQARLG